MRTVFLLLAVVVMAALGVAPACNRGLEPNTPPGFIDGHTPIPNSNGNFHFTGASTPTFSFKDSGPSGADAKTSDSPATVDQMTQ